MITYKSINQINASLDEREKYLKEIENEIERPSVFLQTCNRVEVYEGDGDVPNEVARHLFRVVSGLESALIGERAVQGQVKEAYINARNKFKLPAPLHKLFEYALLVGKKVRTDTEISHGAVSHSLAAIEIVESERCDLLNSRITLIGVNKLTQDILLFLKNKGSHNVTLANRSVDNAERLAKKFGCVARSLDEEPDFLKNTDILISATSAPGLIVKASDIDPDQPLLAIDLAFPRDIDPNIAKFANVKLFNLTDVERRVQKNIKIRETEVSKAEAIIEEGIAELQETLARRIAHLQKEQ